MLAVRDSNPDLAIYLLFGKAQNRLNKKSKTTYAKWAQDNGFKWAEGSIPQEWIDEPEA